MGGLFAISIPGICFVIWRLAQAAICQFGPDGTLSCSRQWAEDLTLRTQGADALIVVVLYAVAAAAHLALRRFRAAGVCAAWVISAAGIHAFLR